LQHIPVPRGLRLLRRLVALLAEGGVGALHLTYHSGEDSTAKGAGWFRRMARYVRHWTGLRPSNAGPAMLMGDYPLNEVFRLLHEAGVRRLWTELTNHGGPLGLNLLFRKTEHAPPDQWC
jgi:hypothetical protein